MRFLADKPGISRVVLGATVPDWPFAIGQLHRRPPSRAASWTLALLDVPGTLNDSKSNADGQKGAAPCNGRRTHASTTLLLEAKPERLQPKLIGIEDRPVFATDEAAIDVDICIIFR